MGENWSIVYNGERTFHECAGRLFDASRRIEFDPVTLQEIKREVVPGVKETTTITQEPKVDTVMVMEPVTTPESIEAAMVPPCTGTIPMPSCEVCGFVAKSNAGMSAHKRKAHKE